MGGGPFKIALFEHIKNGFKVCITDQSAKSIKDNPDEVRKTEIEIISEDEATKILNDKSFTHIKTSDIDIDTLRYFLEKNAYIFEPEIVAVAVQDHGYAGPNENDNITRFRLFKDSIPGRSSAFFHVPAPVLIKNTSNKYLGSIMSSYQIGGELSRTIGSLLIIATISWFGLKRIYYLAPIAIIVSILLFLKLKNNTSIIENKIDCKMQATGQQGSFTPRSRCMHALAVKKDRSNKPKNIDIIGCYVIKIYGRARTSDYP